MGRRTEYKRQFKEPSKDMHNEYRSNHQYCILRRQLEHRHNFVEWDWDSESENGQVFRHHDLNVNNCNREVSADDAEKVRVAKQVQTPDWKEKQRAEPVHHSTPDRNHQINSEKRNLQSAGRKSSGKKRRSVSKQKRKSLPNASPEKASNSKHSDLTPPFLAFGWADATKGIGAKKTFNIRAANEVHPAALRAFKRRELDILREEEERKKENLKKKRARALFNSSPHQKDDVWLTEYQRNFSGRLQSR